MLNQAVVISLHERDLHLQFLSVLPVRCADCGWACTVPYEYGARRGLVDPAGTTALLADHALQNPEAHRPVAEPEAA
jgi:hypothetical protein